MFKRRARSPQPFRVNLYGMEKPPAFTPADNARSIIGLIGTIVILLGMAWLSWALQPAGDAFANFIDRLAGVHH
jgi:hypothetical protein